MCQAGLPESCLGISCESSPPSTEGGRIESDPSLTLEEISEQEESDDSEEEEEEDTRGSLKAGGASGPRRRGLKRDAMLRDQQSTGRKRAAVLYPLDKDSPCEWRGKANCGGGKYPIIGCLTGLQQARQHGPDKSVSNNSPGNVQRICHYCHNRWHAANDPEYDWNNPDVTPNSPRPMTEEERMEATWLEFKYKHKKSLRDNRKANSGRGN